MKKYQWIIILINLILLLVLFNSSVFSKEKLLTDGDLILLELAPVDPRSLMQGDYMRLRYAITNNVNDFENLPPKRGYCVITLDTNGVAQYQRFQKEQTPLNSGEYLIEYTTQQTSGWSMSIGAESYFFQEGDAEKYELGKYGGIKVDAEGNSLLIGLYDEHRNLIE